MDTTTPANESPAAVVIRICGGIKATAELIGRHRSAVNRWTLPKSQGGRGGLVPMEAQHELMREATAANIPLKHKHFFWANA